MPGGLFPGLCCPPCQPPCGGYKACFELLVCRVRTGNVVLNLTNPDGIAETPVVIPPPAGFSNIFKYCITDPMPGDWFYTATYPNHDIVTGTFTVANCASQTIKRTLVNRIADLPKLCPFCSPPPLESRTVTVTGPSGTHTYGCPKPNPGTPEFHYLEVDVSSANHGDQWTYTVPPPDAGFVSVPGWSTLLQDPPGSCKIISSFYPDGNPPEEYASPPYCEGCCACWHYGDGLLHRSTPRVLTYSDPYGTCQLTVTVPGPPQRCGVWKGGYTFNAQSALPCIIYGVGQGYWYAANQSVNILIEAQCNFQEGPWIVFKTFKWNNLVLEPACPTPPPPFPQTRPAGHRMMNSGVLTCRLRAVSAEDVLGCGARPAVHIQGMFAHAGGDGPNCGSVNGWGPPQFMPPDVAGPFSIVG